MLGCKRVLERGVGWFGVYNTDHCIGLTIAGGEKVSVTLAKGKNYRLSSEARKFCI